MVQGEYPKVEKSFPNFLKAGAAQISSVIEIFMIAKRAQMISARTLDCRQVTFVCKRNMRTFLLGHWEQKTANKQEIFAVFQKLIQRNAKLRLD